QNTVSTKGIGGTNNSTKVMGILNLVQRHNKRFLVFLLGRTQHVLHAGITKRGNSRHNTLMQHFAHHVFKGALTYSYHRDTVLLGNAHHVGNTGLTAHIGNPKTLYVSWVSL